MKKTMTTIRSLVLGLLVCAGVGACSDDAIKGEQNEVQANGTPAYLTIAFSTNGNAASRSTADEGANNGDTDGDAEDSGHHNTGTVAENKVNRVLVVACPDGGNVGFAKLYTNTDIASGVPVDKDQEEGYKDFWVYQDKVTTGDTAEPIRLAVGKYKIMVVVNPVSALLKTGFTSTSDVSEVRDLYRKILDEEYAPSKKDVYDALYLKGAAEETGFMMGNKSEVTVELKEEHTPENPQTGVVEVERTLSKITYRPGGLDENNQPTTNNKYYVKIETTAEAVTVENVKLEGYDTPQTLNKATDINGKLVYVLYLLNGETKEPEFKAVYGAIKNGNDKNEIIGYKELRAIGKDEEATDDVYVVENTDKPEASLTLAKDVTASEAFIIELKGYALVNLSKTVNYVRHTVYAGENLGKPFGRLNGQNFLWTPYWADKNAIMFDEQNKPTDAGAWLPGTWYYNTLEEISAESKQMTIDADGTLKVGDDKAIYYKPMSDLFPDPDNVNNGNQTVIGNGTQHPEKGKDLPDIGNVMGYCLENSTDIAHQTHGLSTGISFVATVSKPNGDPVESLYKYGGHTYTSLANIQKAYGNLAEGFQDLVKAEADGKAEDLTKVNLAKYNIVKYESNVCYYFTNEIKHFDNGNNAVLGNMEYAIMRNNIYSLSVAHIDAVGDPFVDPTPGIPNETGKAALKLQVKIMPWVVRYNNFEF